MPVAIFRRLILSYLAIIGVVWLGVFTQSGWRHVNLFLIFSVSFLLFSSALSYLLMRVPSGRSISPVNLNPILFLGIAIVATLSHWILLGGFPLLDALQTTNPDDIVLIRQTINSHGPVFNYISLLLIKTVFPLLVLKFLIDGRYHWAAMTAVIGMIYAASLMQKSFLIFVTATPCIYLFMSEKKTVAIGGLFAVAAAIMGSSVIAHASGINLLRVMIGLADRLFSVPGNTVASWLNAFPSPFPFEHGCGYRFIAVLRGCTFVNNSEIMFNFTSPDLVRKGFFGTMNAAHFAEDYANFGEIGLILAAALVVLCIGATSIATARVGIAASVALNLPFVAILSSTALHTTILSGGWLAMVLLSLFVLKSGEANQSLKI